MGNYSPDLPYVVGMQWAPMLTDQVLLDTSTEVGYTFRGVTDWTALNTTPDRVRVLAPAPPGQPVRKELVVNMYRDGQVTATGAIRKLVIPCATGVSVAGAALGGGAASFQQAVQNPSDARFVSLTGPNAAARFWFATTTAGVTAALGRRRVLDVTVVYAMSGPFDTAVPGAVTLGLERPSANLNWLMDDTLTGPAGQGGSVKVRRARLGELNPWWSPTLTPAATTMRLPWKAYGASSTQTPTAGLDTLAAAGGANINLRVGAAAGVAAGMVFQIHHLALEITYCEDSRVGAGGLDISGGATMTDGAYFYDVPIRGVYNFGYPLAYGPGSRYALTVGQAYSGALSVASPVPVLLARLGTIGAFPDHGGIVLRKTIREAATPVVELSALMPALVPVTAMGIVEVGAHAYTAQAVGTCDDFPRGANSQVLLDAAAGTYVWATFYARHLPATVDPLIVLQVDAPTGATELGPGGQVTVQQFAALPEIVNGWKKVTVRLDPPVRLAGDGSLLRFGFVSAAGDGAPWQVLGADSNPTSQAASPANLASFDAETGFARFDDQPDLSADYALTLAREMDPVTGFTITPAVQQLATVDPDRCGPGRPVPTGIRYLRLGWDAVNSEMVRGWAYFEVQRQDDTMPADVWETIAQVAEPTVTGVDDYEARVGVNCRYRIRTMHRTGIGGPWTDPVTVSIPAPGVTGTHTGVGVLILTSNHHPAANLAYVMSWDRRAPEDFTFAEAGQVDLQAMYQRDYRLALRPSERGGVEFTRTVLVNAAAIPAETLDKGFRQLRDLAWDQVPYVCVRDELHNRWLSALLVPSGTVQRRPAGQVQLAQLTVVEVTDTPAPLPGAGAACEGLRPEGALSVEAFCDSTIDTMSTLAGSDSFDRQVNGGWGATDQPGQPWQVTQGPPANVSVADGAGSITIAPIRNSNPFFETSAAGWTGYGATVARSTAQAHQGTASLLLTPDGVSPSARAESDQATGAATGVDSRATAWVRCPIARTAVLSINWYTTAGVYLGTSTAAAVTLTANTWTRLSFTAASPFTGTARAAVNVTMTGTPPAAHLLFIDEATIGPAPAPTQLVTAPVLADVDVRARFRVDQMAVGAPIQAGLIARDAGGRHYRGVLSFRTDAAIGVSIERVDAGVTTVIAAEQVVTANFGDPFTYTPGQWIGFAFEARGQMLLVSAFPDGAVPGWPVSAVDTTNGQAGQIGVRATAGAGNQNLAVRVDVDNVRVRIPVSDLDVRMLLRPTSEDTWDINLEYDSLFARPDGGFEEMASTGMQLSPARMCTYVFTSSDEFEGCATVAQLHLTPRQQRWIRYTYQQNIGAGLARMSFLTSVDGHTWTSAGSLTGRPEPLPIDPGAWLLYLDGAVTLSRLEWRDGINGRVIASPDFAAQPAGTTSFADAQGNQWGISGRGICATP
jgi:hypothetical protein